jgi:hypothetical protein
LVAVALPAIALLLVIVVPALVVGLVVWLVARSTSDDGGAPARRARRHELLVATLAVLAAGGTAVALIVQPIGWPDWAPAPGILQALTPFAVAVAFGAVRAVGELTWPRPRGTVRAAPLARRTPWTVGGARLRWVLGTAATTVVVLVTTGLTADETGRALTVRTTYPDGATGTLGGGPYPGWPYGVPMLIGLTATMAITWVALQVITRRAPLHALPAAHDAAVRRTSASRLLAVVQLCLGVALGLTTFLAGGVVRNIGTNLELNGVEGGIYAQCGTAVMIVGAVVVLASVLAALVGVWSRRVPRSNAAPGAWAVA